MENTTNNTANTTTNVDFNNFAPIAIHSERLDVIKSTYKDNYLMDKPDSNIRLGGFVLWTWSPSIKTESSRLFNSKEHKSLEPQALGKLIKECWMYASKYIGIMAKHAIVIRVERASNNDVSNVILSFKPSSALRLAECEEALKDVTVDTSTMDMANIKIWSYSLECFVDINGNRIAGGLNTTKEDSMD